MMVFDDAEKAVEDMICEGTSEEALSERTFSRIAKQLIWNP